MQSECSYRIYLSLSWPRSVKAMPFYPTSWNVHFNIILPSTPRFSKWSLSLRSPHQKSVCTFSVSHTCQRISPSPRPCEVYRSVVRFYAEELLAPHQPPSWRTFLAGCPRLIIQYTHTLSYHPYLEAFPQSALWTSHAVVTRTLLSRT